MRPRRSPCPRGRHSTRPTSPAKWSEQPDGVTASVYIPGKNVALPPTFNQSVLGHEMGKTVFSMLRWGKTWSKTRVKGCIGEGWKTRGQRHEQKQHWDVHKNKRVEGRNKGFRCFGCGHNQWVNTERGHPCACYVLFLGVFWLFSTVGHNFSFFTFCLRREGDCSCMFYMEVGWPTDTSISFCLLLICVFTVCSLCVYQGSVPRLLRSIAVEFTDCKCHWSKILHKCFCHERWAECIWWQDLTDKRWDCISETGTVLYVMKLLFLFWSVAYFSNKTLVTWGHVGYIFRGVCTYAMAEGHSYVAFFLKTMNVYRYLSLVPSLFSLDNGANIYSKSETCPVLNCGDWLPGYFMLGCRAGCSGSCLLPGSIYCAGTTGALRSTEIFSYFHSTGTSGISLVNLGNVSTHLCLKYIILNA